MHAKLSVQSIVSEKYDYKLNSIVNPCQMYCAIASWEIQEEVIVDHNTDTDKVTRPVA